MPRRSALVALAGLFAAAFVLVNFLTSKEMGASTRPAVHAGAADRDLTASVGSSARPTDEAALRALLERAAAEGMPGCLETPYGSAIIDPRTPPERLPEILEWLARFYGQEIDPSKSSFYKVGRWTGTATDSSGGFEGDPLTLTWGIVADGTLIDLDQQGGHVPSVLNAVFDVNFPSHDIWVNQIRDCFNRWSERAGMTYIEVADDGATSPESLGVLGVRGDIRIGGRNIDGQFGVLAYNFYPNNGDMVIDVADVNSFKNATNTYRYLRNTVMHEQGHGLGLGHVVPVNGTKLMEPFISTAYLGQQDDDIRGGQKLYGDSREQNDDSLSATVLGAIVDSMRIEQLSLDKGGDIDWYRFTAAGGADVTITVDPVGSTYQVAPDGSTPVTVKTDSILNLQFALYEISGSQLALVDAAGLGGTEVLSNFPIPQTGDYLIRVFKSGTGGLNALQRYELLVETSASLVAVPGAGGAAPQPLDLSIVPNPILTATRARFRLAAGSLYAFEIFDLSGRRVRTISGRAPSGSLAEVAWDVADERGARVASGVYFLRVRSGALSETQRAVILR